MSPPAAFSTALSARPYPVFSGVSLNWWDLQCIIAIFWGCCMPSNNLCIICPCFLGDLLEVHSPLSFQMALWTWTTPKANFESVCRVTVLSCGAPALWQCNQLCFDVLGVRALASITSCWVSTAFPAFQIPSFTKLLPSMESLPSASSRGVSCRSSGVEYFCSMADSAFQAHPEILVAHISGVTALSTSSDISASGPGFCNRWTWVSKAFSLGIWTVW